MSDILQSFGEHESALRRFLTAKLGCAQTAADVLQKMAENLLSQKRRPIISSHKAYLFKVARNEAVSYHRAESRRTHYESDAAQHTEEVEYRDAERIAIAENSLDRLNEALLELPLLSRQIFVLYRIEGLKQRQIALQLNLNLSTVEKRLAAAMRHCRSRLFDLPIYCKTVSQTSLDKEQ